MKDERARGPLVDGEKRDESTRAGEGRGVHAEAPVRKGRRRSKDVGIVLGAVPHGYSMDLDIPDHYSAGLPRGGGQPDLGTKTTFLRRIFSLDGCMPGILGISPEIFQRMRIQSMRRNDVEIVSA
ncbi:uncharacterized protein LOC143178219 [Calliopsis andreniformis]|uniref:uncharacterized protein LOC143178219 n=1 Tax=Calliopsis andreniformis TaxID=337506 RepID=UPI003FCC92B8